MLISRRDVPILVVNLIYFPFFSALAVSRSNYEFMLYAGVILVVAISIILAQHRVRFSGTILWGLTIWGLLHMAGGNLRVGDDVLYGLVLVPILPSYEILRYDHFVHLFGFAVATLICHHLLRPYLQARIEHWFVLSILIVLMGSGVGAINEIIEFLAVKTMPRTGVGGYDNTLLDMVFNLLGGLLAVFILSRQRRQAIRRSNDGHVASELTQR